MVAQRAFHIIKKNMFSRRILLGVSGGHVARLAFLPSIQIVDGIFDDAGLKRVRNIFQRT